MSLRTGNESDGRGGYSSSPSSPIVYWSEFENPVQPPYTIEVDEHAPLLPWLYRKRKADLETASIEHLNSESGSSFTRALDKIREVVKWEVKTSAEGLTALFYEKEFLDSDDEEEVESPSDESSSDLNATHALARRHRHHVRRLADREISRPKLLNRGYFLCVVGCVLFCCFLGTVGLIFNGDTTGIAFVLVGFLISMSLEIVSLVRFIMYLPSSGLTRFVELLTDVTGKVATPGLPGLALLSLHWSVVFLFRWSSLVRKRSVHGLEKARQTPWSFGNTCDLKEWTAVGELTCIVKSCTAYCLVWVR